MKWPLKLWMAPKWTRLSRNSPLRLVGWAGRQTRLLWAVACVAVQKGQRLLDTRWEPSGRRRPVNLLHLPIDSPTEESTLIRPDDSPQSVCFFPFLFFLSFFLSRACCTPHALHVDSNYTARHDDHSVGLWPAEDEWGVSPGMSYWFHFFFCQSERDCCLVVVLFVFANPVTINVFKSTWNGEHGYRRFKKTSHPKQITCGLTLIAKCTINKLRQFRFSW